MTLVVDPWHWLNEDGTLPIENPRLRRKAIRVARFIEYGGDLDPGESRETLIECRRRPGRVACLGLMWVTKTDQDAILGWCPACGDEEIVVHNWQETVWADGVMEATPAYDGPVH